MDPKEHIESHPKHSQNSINEAFTLVELIVCFIILSALAGAAITNYLKTTETAEARNAILIARSIQAAEEVYLVKNGVYWPEVDGVYTVDDINTALGLNLGSGNLYIWCDNDPAAGFTFPVYDCCLMFPPTDSRWQYEIAGHYKYPASVNLTGTAPINMPVCLKSDAGC